jgi:hypothetical protein
MGRYEGHTNNENRPEAADKERLVDLVWIEPMTSSMAMRPQQYIQQSTTGYGN